jgi:hypothetical protein
MNVLRTVMVAALPLALAAGCTTDNKEMVDTTARTQAQQAQEAANRAAASAQQAADAARQAAAAAERAANESKASSDRVNAMFQRGLRKR